MAMPYVGEIRMFAGNFEPAGWMYCSGQLLPISEYEVLFQLIGTTYGGDGQSTYALPDLRGRLPLHQGNGFVIGQNGGVETVTLTVSQIPAHTHAALAQADAGSVASPANAVWAGSPLASYAAVAGPILPMAANLISPTGGSQPHDNRMPYLPINFIISLFGIFPSPS